ncbi:iron chelate uptake ABC transporter family permease subunit, partial [Mycobacterium tuberculosis]|nr:iron chelate uptake ABC transporter family permease subunit [Mycobacterium tuberculosis]
DWAAVRLLAVHLGGGAVAAAVLARPLTLINLDDAIARGLGVGVGAARLAALAVAVQLAAAVVAAVGVVGFVGLAAPALVRLAGVHGAGRRLALAPFAGAALLL